MRKDKIKFNKYFLKFVKIFIFLTVLKKSKIFYIYNKKNINFHK